MEKELEYVIFGNNGGLGIINPNINESEFVNKIDVKILKQILTPGTFRYFIFKDGNWK